MISPNDLKNLDTKKADELIEKIDKAIVSNHGNFTHESALIEGEYPVEVRNKVGKMYKKAGWKYVYHQTSSENGEQPGLTHFILSTVEVPEYVVRGFIECIDESDCNSYSND